MREEGGNGIDFEGRSKSLRVGPAGLMRIGS